MPFIQFYIQFFCILQYDPFWKGMRKIFCFNRAVFFNHVKKNEGRVFLLNPLKRLFI